MTISIESPYFEQAFTQAHTAHRFADEPIPDDALRVLYDVARLGPTSMNCQPMRLVFVRSEEAKARLREALAPGNVDKTMNAPVTVIVAMDKQFHEHLPSQFPFVPNAAHMYRDNPQLSQTTALRNSSLQGAYLMIAARLAGLAVGPMSGFDHAKIDAEFFPDGKWACNFLFNLGMPDAEGHRPRGTRLSFEDVAVIR